MALLILLTALVLLSVARKTPALAVPITLTALLLAVVAGLTLPDIDQPLPLDHRSAVTHSILPALLASIRRWMWPLAAGLALGLGLHLAADVFPDAMIGFATVKIPFGGSIGSDASYYWLGGNALACTVLGGWLISQLIEHRTTRLILIGVIAFIGMAYLLTVDGGLPAILLYLGAGWLAIRRNPATRHLHRHAARSTADQ